jgi:serine/threonine protein kinase/Leucine-rich repeat (LRR) protein
MVHPPVRVIAIQGGRELARYSLAPGNYVIGQSADCELRLEADGISNRHALLSINHECAVSVKDLAGVNGTFLDGEPVAGSAQVLPNQTLQLGAISLLVQQRIPADGDAYAETADLLPAEFRQGERYEIGPELARGGMGEVLTARQVTIRRSVALKRILGDASLNPRQRLRFIEEAQITGQLEHPNIVPVYDLATDVDGQPYYTMKLVQGITLKKVLQLLEKDTPATVAKYPLAALLTIFQKVCDAVAFAHAKGVIHRDLKPANIMVGSFGEVLVMDWGLAKILRHSSFQNQEGARGPSNAGGNAGRSGPQLQSVRSEEGDGFATLNGAVIGTPHFMAPEQARGDIEQLDERSDVFSLGSILYQILTLQYPFPGRNVAEILEKIQSGDFIPPAKRVFTQASRSGEQSRSLSNGRTSVRPAAEGGSVTEAIRRPVPHLPGGRVPESLDAIVRKAMASKREERYQSVKALQDDLTAYQTGFATSVERRSGWKQLKLLIRRHKATSLGIAAVLLVGSVLGTGAIVQGRRATKALSDLKKTAPALRQLADSEASFQRFRSAVDNIDAAMALDPEHLPSYWRRAWLHLGMEDFAGAAASLIEAQRKDPAGIGNAAILPIVEQLASVPEGERWTAERRDALYQHLKKMGASAEVTALTAKLQTSAEVNLAAVRERLDEWLGKGKGSAFITTAGLIEVRDLPRTVQSLVHLQGMPINILDLSNLQIRDIEALRNTPLVSINISSTKVTDIEPLRNKGLTHFVAHHCKITDWSPLAGMPLRRFSAVGGTIDNLSFLADAPIEEIEAADCSLRDISGLKGAPVRTARLPGNYLTSIDSLTGSAIESLVLHRNPLTSIAGLNATRLKFLDIGDTKIKDLTPLRGSTITHLNLSFCPIADFQPLVDMPALQELWLGRHSRPDVLRGHPTLEFINWGDFAEWRRLPILEFWEMYETQRSGERVAAQKKIDDLIAAKGRRAADGSLILDFSRLSLTELPALKGLAISTLWVDQNPFSDLSPLKGMPLEALGLRRTQVLDLSPLRGMPLRMLHLFESQVSDLSPLRGMPLEYLYFDGTPVTDVSPLLEMPHLKRVMLPRAATNIEVLRSLTKLEYIGWEHDWHGDDNLGRPVLTATEFWKRFDELKTPRDAE